MAREINNEMNCLICKPEFINYEKHPSNCVKPCLYWAVEKITKE